VTATPAAPPAANPGDSLFYSIQIAAFSQADQAAAYAREFGDAYSATVSPVQLGRQGLWFRVIVGAFATAGEADSLLRAWWQRGTVERPNGAILRTPHALLVEQNASPEAARETVLGLRRQGVAAYIVPAPDGSALVFVGAFEAPDQARSADSLLRPTGLQTTLAYRMGTRR
jgi:cell division septation protein DedD